jgi:hypothetical protein
MTSSLFAELLKHYLETPFSLVFMGFSIGRLQAGTQGGKLFPKK